MKIKVIVAPGYEADAAKVNAYLESQGIDAEVSVDRWCPRGTFVINPAAFLHEPVA